MSTLFWYFIIGAIGFFAIIKFIEHRSDLVLRRLDIVDLTLKHIVEHKFVYIERRLDSIEEELREISYNNKE